MMIMDEEHGRITLPRLVRWLSGRLLTDWRLALHAERSDWMLGLEEPP
jgi:hypothetical protein